MIKVILCAIAALFCTIRPAASAARQVSVTADEKAVVCSRPVCIVNDCAMIYYKDIADILGVSIEWDQSTETVTVGRYYYDESIVTEFTMTVNDKHIDIDGHKSEIAAPAEIIGGELYLPLRSVAESLNAAVDWNEQCWRAELTTNTPRAILNGRFNMVLPVSAGAYEVYDWILTEDEHYNSTHVRIASDNNEVTFLAIDLFRTSTGDIEKDAKYLRYSIDPDRIFRGNGIEAVCESSIYATGRGHILIKTADNFLIELECQIHLNDSAPENYTIPADALWQRVMTVSNGNKTIDTAGRTYRFMVFNAYYNVPVPNGYYSYITYEESGSSIHIIKPVSTDKKRPELDISHCGLLNDAAVIRTVEGSFLNHELIWNICEDGTAYADNQQWHLSIRGADSQETEELIAAAANITYETPWWARW